MIDKINIEEIFAQNVFTLDTMRKWVTEDEVLLGEYEIDGRKIIIEYSSGLKQKQQKLP